MLATTGERYKKDREREKNINTVLICLKIEDLCLVPFQMCA